MSGKRLLTLALIALLVLLGAGWLLSQRQADSTTDSAALFADLANEADQLTEVSISALGSAEAVTLTRTDQQWGVLQRAGYPVDLEKLRGLLQALSEARLAEAKTSKAENHGQLGLAAEGDDAGIKISLNGSDALAVIVGDVATRRDANYVRRPSEDQTWLLDRRIDASTELNGWLAKDLLDIPATDVQRVEIRHPTEPVIFDATEDSFALDNMPGDRQLSYPSIGNTVAGALSSLRLEDVQRYDPDAVPADAVETVFTTKSGLQLTLRTWRSDEHSLIHVTAQDAPLATAPSEDAEPVMEVTAADDAEETALDPVAEPPPASETPQQLNERLDDWVFQISQYQFDNLRKTRDDLLAPVD